MGIVTKYKFNQTIYENFIPTFNSEFTDYTITDEIDTDGFTIRTIESNSLPTLMRFGATTQTDREKSLLEVYECNTSNITNMGSMFVHCSSLTSLNVSNFNTSQVTSMSYMFSTCSSLTSLDVSNFDTNKVTDMQNMFYACSSLTSLDVSSFDTSKVRYMIAMFSGCSLLTSLDLSNFNTSEVTNMYSMFSDCSSLTSLDVSNFDTSQVTNMSNMFYHCSLLINIGGIYCNSLTINKISDLITTNTTIWYSDAKLEDLTKKENITYKEYKMNILESDEEINLRRIGDVYDELNLETGKLTQRIGEIVLDGTEDWIAEDLRFRLYRDDILPNKWSNGLSNHFIGNRGQLITNSDYDNYFAINGYGSFLYVRDIDLFPNPKSQLNEFKSWLSERIAQGNPVILQYCLSQEVVKTINLKGKPSIDWQGDTYIHLENNTLYPQLDCEVESINYYEIPKLKANTLYTLRYVGEPTQCIFGGLTYKTENNMILTSGSSDNLLYFDKEVRNVILIEGDVRDRNFDYFEGIESLGAVEIVTHKSDMSIFSKIQLPPHIQLHRLPDGTCDELDIKTGILTRRIQKIVLNGSEMSWNLSSSKYARLYDLTPKKGSATDYFITDSLLPINFVHGEEGIAFGTDVDGNITMLTIRTEKLYNGQSLNDFKKELEKEPITIYYALEEEVTEKLILNYNNSCNYGVILPKGTSDNYNVITTEYKQNLNFIPIDGSIAFDTATIKNTTVKYSVALSKFEVDTTNVRGSDGIYCDNNLFKYEASDNDYEHAYIENDTTLHIYVNKNRLSSYDQVGFQLYLTSNPFNIYYAMRTPIISYVNYEDLDAEKASWEMLDCTEDGSITIESGDMDKTLLLDCMDYVAPTKNRFEIDLLKANTQYTVYAEGVSGSIQLNFGGNIVNFTSGNVYTSGETQLVEFYTDNEIKNLIIIEGDTRSETIEFFEGLKSSENVTVISSNAPYVFGKGGKIQ